MLAQFLASRGWVRSLSHGRLHGRRGGGSRAPLPSRAGRARTAGPKSPAQRAMHRADRIADRLHDKWKGTTKRKWEFRPKPSWMRWETYQRLKRQYDELRGRWMAGLMGRF